MALRRVAKLTVGVPNVAETAGYYTDFGLVPSADERTAFSTSQGGEYNGVGRVERPNSRAPGVLNEAPVAPRRLGHFVLGSTDYEGAAGLYRWGPSPPPSFLHPDDLAALMTGSHSAGG